MLKFNTNDTIVAIATSMGESGIGIVRISGKCALKIADRIFVSKNNQKASTFKTYTTHYGWIMDKGEIIDEVILTIMRKPRSFTREDVVEINCHGGLVALRRVLELVLENNCRLAEPGEFTKRAFLNGRIDLTQAEAVLDIIRAKTDCALNIGLEQLRGGLSGKINKIRKRLLDIVSQMEANIDFPEEEIGSANLKQMRENLLDINNELLNILATSKRGRIMREGIHVVICGKPNVGKSSLLNALLKQERSIVTPVAGTTRDTIEEIIDIKGIPVRIVDTAGILEPKDLIEKKAVQRSKRHIGLADLVILVFDGSRPLTDNDELLMRKLNKGNVIAAINKSDLRQLIKREKILKKFKYVVDISAKKLKNINLLEDKIVNLVYGGKVAINEPVTLNNLRHISSMQEAQILIAQAVNSSDNNLSLEFVSQSLKDALLYLDDILGLRFSEDLLDKIFSDFCIGK